MSARVLVTRASGQSGPLEAALQAHGLDPIAVPTIAVELEPPGGELDAVARVLQSFHWVVLTSPNGARAILAAAGRVGSSLSTATLAVIGAGTAEILERADLRAAFLPSRPEAGVLAEELPIAQGERVLLLRGDLAGDDLPARLRDRGAVVTDLVAYRTVEAPSSSRRLLRAAFVAGEPDAVVLASGSAARGLLAMADAEGLDIRAVPAICIGPETRREATRLGFRILATSPRPDPPTLAAAAAAALTHSLEMR